MWVGCRQSGVLSRTDIRRRNLQWCIGGSPTQLNLDYSYVQGTAKIGVSAENGRVHEDISVDVSQMRRVVKGNHRRPSPTPTSSVHHDLPHAGAEIKPTAIFSPHTPNITATP